MNVIIVDDEPLAVELLETYVMKVPGLNLVGTCSNAIEAFVMLNKQQVDVMLLDINMPEISGIEFLKNLKKQPNVILTTAYSEYALESYDHSVCDYLVKPITFERFMRAFQKLMDRQGGVANSKKQEDQTILVRTEGKMMRLELDKLLIVEGYKNYVRLWTVDGKTVVHNTMTNFEDFLNRHPHFIRVHKSYIINLDHIREVTGNYISIAGQDIVIGATYREGVNAALKRFTQL
jgi:DNA-binding LytR/AlgR family response regulator